MVFQGFLANISIGAISAWDILLILIGLLAVFVYGFFVGKNRMLLLMMSSYFSLAIVLFIPWDRLSSIEMLGIGDNPSPSLKLLIFISFVIFLFLFMPRSIISSVSKIKKRGEATWVQLFLLSFFQVGLLGSIGLSFFPAEATANLAIQKILLGPGPQFIWIVLPILVVVLMRRRKELDKK